MEPLDTDLDYTQEESPSKPGSRMSALLIFPVLGFLFVLLLIAAVLFQIDLSDLISPFMGLMMLLFFVVVIMLFWALSYRASQA